MREFCKLNLPTFSGEPTPLVVEDWLKQITKVLNGMKVTDDETRVSLVTFQLKAEAEVWWESVRTTRGKTRVDWDTFQQLFLDEYFPAVERRKKKQEFHDLKQKMMTVSEYVAKFNALARFAPGMVSTEIERMDKFEEGLRLGLQKMMAAHPYKTYAKMVDVAKRAESQEQRERETDLWLK